MTTFVTKIKEYLFGAYNEARKVTWPTRKQTTTYSLVVLALTLGLTIFFGVLDFAISQGFTKLIK